MSDRKICPKCGNMMIPRPWSEYFECTSCKFYDAAEKLKDYPITPNEVSFSNPIPMYCINCGLPGHLSCGETRADSVRKLLKEEMVEANSVREKAEAEEILCDWCGEPLRLTPETSWTRVHMMKGENEVRTILRGHHSCVDFSVPKAFFFKLYSQ